MNAKSTAAQTRKPLAAGRWRLDPSASTAEFRVPHFWGLVTVKGHFERLDGYLEFDDGQ
jgi:polyisoprenoid-binding protein YceI